MSLSAFAEDVDKAFSSTPKAISSKYFYDDEGSELFRAIMSMEEYYLTDCEFEVFETQGLNIISEFFPGSQQFDVVELGAGDGMKTKVLLKKLLDTGCNFRYRPIDISSGAMEGLSQRMKKEFPNMELEPVVGEYFSALQSMKSAEDNIPKVVLFLGSNIGNFPYQKAQSFLSELSDSMNDGDLLLIGIDLKKNPHTIRLAYADPHGITKRFNLNLLKRINRELGGDFNLDDFGHYQSYDPVTGEVRSYIFSKKDQKVSVGHLNKVYHFGRWEMIHTEISKKYEPNQIPELADSTGFEHKKSFLDCKHYYSDNLWKVVKS